MIRFILPLLARMPVKYKALGAILGLLLVAAAGGYAGWLVQGWRMDGMIAAINLQVAESQLQAAQRTQNIEQLYRETERLAQDKADAIAEAALLRNQERAVVERIITEEVIRYVTVPRDRIAMPNDWVRIHNAAASGQLPSTAFNSSASGSIDAVVPRLAPAATRVIGR